jgi:pimeloyl-ACP methyl ester carboxylesterase
MDWRVLERDILVDGRRLRYVDVGVGPVLLLVHGLGGSWQNWLENIPKLSRDHRVIAVDLPGFGRSDRVPRLRSLAPYAASVVSLLDRLGVADAVVVGHSMGGFVSERLTLQRPDLVRGLVLVSAGGSAVGPRQVAAVQGMLAMRRVAANPGAARRMAQIPWLRRCALAGFVHDPSCVSGRLAEHLMENFIAPGFADAVRVGLREDLRHALHRISAPTLLIWGDRDRVLPVSRARQLAELIPDASLEVWSHVGHCAMLERPVRFNARIRRFTDSLADPSLRMSA